MIGNTNKDLSFDLQNYEREFLVSSIRIGKIIKPKFDILPFSFLDLISSKQVYEDSYNDCLQLNLMTEQETLKFLDFQGSWTNENEEKIELINKEIEECKVEIFEKFFKKPHVKLLTDKINAAKFSIEAIVNKKHSLLSNSCEQIAESERQKWLLQQSVVVKDKNFNIEDDFAEVLFAYNSDRVDERCIRFLARNDPWKSSWSIYNTKCIKTYHDREITQNQKNLIMWSKSYDNISESMECPSEDIINNDYALDGWIIKQNKKYESQKKQAKISEMIGNPKGNEVFVMVDPEDMESRQAIYDMNSTSSKYIIKQREAYLSQHKSCDLVNLPDHQNSLRQAVARSSAQRRRN